jgi:hypothetical protein
MVTQASLLPITCALPGPARRLGMSVYLLKLLGQSCPRLLRADQASHMAVARVISSRCSGAPRRRPAGCQEVGLRYADAATNNPAPPRSVRQL